MDPIDHPTVQLNGKEYQIRYRMLDVLNLAKAGVNIFEMTKETDHIERMKQTVSLVQHGIAHQESLSFDDVAAAIDYGSFARVTLAVGEAIKKASAQIVADNPVKPAAQPTDQPPAIVQ